MLICSPHCGLLVFGPPRDRYLPRGGFRRRKSNMYVNEWWRGCLRVMLPLVPLAAMAIPAHAQSFNPLNPPLGCPSGSTPACVNQDPAGLADTAEPGAVLIFPKFAQGSLTLDSAALVPRTQIEIGAVCPNSLSTPVA